MKFKKLWHYCVVIAGLIVKVNLSGLCSSDSDCTAANTACISSLCNCVQGFTTQNGKCSKVLGRTCLDYADCDDGRTICGETGRCQCQENEWHEVNGMCVSYYGYPCKTWLDCGNGYNYDCIDNVCRCQSGYRFKNTTCEKIIGSLCLLNASKSECPLEHTSCKHWGWWIDTLHGMCVCDLGYSEKDGVCIQVLGSHCDNVPCGYTLHHSYRYLKWDSSEAERWNTEYAYSHLQVSCNIDNVCTCARGFVSVGASCLPVLGRNCVNQNDCGNYPGYICNNQTSECACAPGFYSREERWDYTEEENRKHDEEYYYHHSVNMPSRNIHLCLPVIGQSCFDVSCLNAVANAFCNVDQKCVCTKGYAETNTGSCEKVLGMPCLRESFCQIVEGSTCGNDYTCTCKDGYVRNGHICFHVLGSTCNSNSDCQLSNSECKEGSCACASGYTSFDFKCLRNNCAMYVPVLPDLYRRAVNYRSLTNEPVIDDASLVERWYSIGKQSLLISETTPDPGNCSTFYPLYLRENFSASQLAMMETSEVSLSLEITTLSVYNQSEVVNIKVRKCGTETQIYVQPPKTRFAGFCTSNIRLQSLKRSSGLHALVVPDLLFEPVRIGNRIKNKPFLVFSCLPSELSGTSMSRYPHDSFQNDEDIYFYIVHWHIDGIHFRSFGPVRRRTLVNDTSIFEKDIISAGYKLGFQIRCSFEITEDPTSLKGLLAFSEYFITGFTENEMSLYEYEGSSFRQITSNTPLGCESFEEDTNAYCELNWALVDYFAETSCNITNRADGIPKTCSFSLRGLTFLGSKQMSTSWRDKGRIMSVHENIANETHYIQTQEWLGTKVDITGDLKYTEYRIKFSPATNTTGHQIWNNYQIPDISVHLRSSWLWQDSCRIDALKYPVISRGYYASLLDSVSVDSAGEYLLYRSTHRPVEIQLETEYCKGGRVCMCGITYRNGIEIYTINYCSGVKRQSQVYGVKKAYNPNYVTFIDGTSLSIYAPVGLIMNIYVGQKQSNEINAEGLCIFSNDSYRLRDGRIQKTNNGFLSSWRVSMNESLLNPETHKTFSWTDTYSRCYCSENTTGREVTQHYNYTYPGNRLVNYTFIGETANVFLHHFKCSSDNLCHTNHLGEEWPESLMPSYVLDSVTARMTIQYKGTVPLLHLFCYFDQRYGFRYKIIWKLDGDFIFQSEVMTSKETEQFYITNDDFKSEKFLLEAEFSCGVSVHDDSGALLLDTVYSEEIAAIEIVKTKVLLPRGGEVTLQLKLNVRLICEKSSSCYFDFQLFDPEDSNNCADSSVAFKSKYTCGQRVIGIDLASSTSNQQSVVNITLTTKNDYMYVLRDTFSLKMKLVSSDANSKLWDHTFSKTINIFVRDDDRYWQRNYCFSTNDPRVRTFDGQYYNNMLVGEFVMMKHKTLPVEVQVETFNCGSWRVACTCGVTVRAGRDVFTINHCHGEHITGYLLADDRILKVKRRNEHRYQIYLPHGTQVDVWIISWASYVVNVYIYPSPKDMKEVEGLCGNFDGSIWGDLIHSDGRVTQTLYYYWWWWWSQSDPDEFVKSWGVMSSKSGFQSLTDVDAIEERLESWYKNYMLCVCVGSEGGGAIKCSANEKDTCLSPVEEPGLDVTIAVRQKRSGHLLDKEYKQRMKRLKEKRAVIKDEIHRNIGPRNAEDIDGAVASCNQTLSSSCGILSVKEDGLNVTFEELVYNCGQDRAANPGMNWEALTCEAIEANVEQELKKDIQFQNDNPDIVAAIKETLCVGNCSGHGECSKGTCICFSGYTASDCSIDLKGMVIIEGITGDGICDISQSYCDCIRLTTSGSIETSKYNLVHKEYDFTGGWSVLGTSIGTVVYDNFNEVFVCPEISKRKQRSTNGSTSIADQYVISLSNDGNTFGNVSTVILLDSTCLKVDQGNETYGIHLLSGFCIIGGICYKTNASPTNNVCLKCRDEENVFDWTRIDACGETENVNGKDAISPSIIGVVVGIVGVVVLGVSIAAVCYVKKRLAQRAAVYVGELYEVSPKKIFQTNQLRRNDDNMPEF